MKIKTFILFVTSLFIVGPGFAQDVWTPDDEKIEQEITSPGSPYFHPNLMIRYDAGDSTLTLDEYRRLYYGYIFQESYKPLDPIGAELRILEVMEQHSDMRFDEPALRTLLGLTQEVMRADPFSLHNINLMTFVYQQLGEIENAEASAGRFSKILETILTSGTGLKEESPWHVIRPEHVSDVLGVLGLVAKKRTYVSIKVEYLELVKEYNGKKGVFFDFGRAYKKKPENIDERRNSGLQFNGVTIKQR